MIRYPAELYVALHRGTPGDVAFYERRCKDARRILELGCGDGRVLGRLQRRGRTLVGVDRDPEMLHLARRQFPDRKGLHWGLADMATFQLEERFDAILLPYSGFFCLSPRKKRQCLARVARHLAPDGRFIIDAYGGEWPLPLRGRREPFTDDFEWTANVSLAAERYEVFERNTWWPSRQRLDVVYEYRPSGGGRVRRGSLCHWYLSLDQTRELLEAFGFSCRAQRASRQLSLREHWAIEARRV